jgi:hypothetical protein
MDNLFESVKLYLANDARHSSQALRLVMNLFISICGSMLLYKIMPKFKDMFMKADLKGIDMSKKDKYQM